MKNTKYIQIKNLDELKKYATAKNWDEGQEFFIALNYGLRSSKHIEWNEDKKVFTVWNLIDDTTQKLDEAQILDKQLCNIGEALFKRALYLEDRRTGEEKKLDEFHQRRKHRIEQIKF